MLLYIIIIVLKLLIVVDWCVMTAFLILTSINLLPLLYNPLSPFSRVWNLIYILLIYQPALHSAIFYSIFLLLGSSLILSLSRPSFGERRPSIIMTQYYMMMLTMIFTLSSHSAKSMTRPPYFVPRPCSDLILRDKTIDKHELQRDLHIGKDVDNTIRQLILDIIHDNWDSFYEKGVSQPMLDF